jgi:ribosome-associated protein
MRKLDTAAIELQLQHLRGESNAARQALHTVELWRDRLLEDPQALTRLLREHPHVDRQKLRQLLKNATNTGSVLQNEPPNPAQKKSARALFRFLRDQLDTNETF